MLHQSQMKKQLNILNKNSLGVLIYIKSIFQNLTVCSKSLALFYIGHHLFWLLEKNKKFLLHPNVHDSFSQHICIYVCVSRSSASCSKATAIRWPSLYLILVVYSRKYPDFETVYLRYQKYYYHLLPRTHIHTNSQVGVILEFFCMLTLLQATKLFSLVP